MVGPSEVYVKQGSTLSLTCIVTQAVENAAISFRCKPSTSSNQTVSFIFRPGALFFYFALRPLERHFKKTAKSNNTLSQRLDYFQKALLLTTVTQLKTRTADKNH